MRTLGLVGLSVLLILVLLYQSYFLTEGFGFGIPAASTDTSGTKDTSGGSIPGVLMDCATKTKDSCNGPLCMWDKYHDKCVFQAGVTPDADRQGVTGGYVPPPTPTPMLGPGGLGPSWTQDSSTYGSYKASAADRKLQRAKLLRDIQKIVHNEMLNERGTTGSRYPSNGSCDSSYEEDSCNTPALQQGCEMEDSCY
jgi:hypothetical protein